MHTSNFLAAFLALGFATAAPAAPAPGAPAARAASPAAEQGKILAAAIAVNIQDQQAELATANAMAAILQKNPVDSASWQQERTNLLQYINNGIAIRQANQLITPAGNKATAGLAVVANAQLEELGLATGLTLAGGDKVAENLKAVQTLQKDFSGGIQKNTQNMAEAQQA